MSKDGDEAKKRAAKKRREKRSPTDAEEALRESEGRFRRYFELGLIGMAITSPTKGIIEVNDEIYKILGYERAELLRMTWAEMTHPDDLAADVAEFNRVIAGESEGYVLDKRFIRKDGRIIYANISVKALRRADGSVAYFVALLQDITERKAASARLRRAHEELEQRVIDRTSQLAATIEELSKEVAERKQAEERLQEYEKCVEGLEEQIVVVDRDYRYLLANRAFLNYRGLKREQLMGQQVPDLLNPGVFEQVAKKKLDECLQGKVVRYELRYDYPHLGARDLFISYFPIEGPSGVDRVACVLQDITERKRAEAELQTAQAELAHVTRVATLGELTASIAHEVNQPLGAIVTNGNACQRLLARATPDLEGALEAVDAMVTDALRAGEVIKRMRAFLRKTVPEKVPVNINEAIRGVASLVASELVRQQVSLRTKLEEDISPVIGDRVQLQQVMLNLSLNAIEAMSSAAGQSHELLLSTGQSGADEITVTVRDTGRGLDPQDGERIFDAFFTTKEGGLGLGLSISRTIIEAHGGRLWATANEDQGATFQFTLPAQATG
ncbi:MAG TPA: PAS domain S-box protein [Pyrinomonadaceae bacterium]|jgi:PAS domain S-box-containing protein|nr:PAS domain S-box protein [Pyrinomonadaceae bacterium]